MPLMPERVKYRKMQRGHRTGIASRCNTVAFGEYGLQALERCWLDTKQIEAARVARRVAGDAVRDGLRGLGRGAGPVDVFGLGRATSPEEPPDAS